MKLLIPGLTAVLAGSLTMATAAELTGKVTLKGKPKDEIPIDLGPACGPLNPNTGKVTTRHYVVGEGGGLGNVFVYLKDAKAAPATGEGPLLDQVGCMYEPFVLGAVVNQKVKIRNSDPTLHNVHATPKVNREFNFAQAVKGRVDEKSFEQAEILVRMKCDVHPWMFSYIGVVEHPYFAVTDKDGNFKISGVPDGQYTVVAYHLKTHGANPGVSQSVAVKGSAKQDFTVELP
jgi:hypothetical protein